MTATLSCDDILESLTTSVVVMDMGLHIIKLNPAAEILFGLSQRQARLIPIHALLVDDGGLMHSLERVRETQHAFIEREVKLYIPGAGEVVTDCAIKPLNTGNEDTLILLEIAQIDFQQRINQDENLNTQQLVLRGLAHEIKNPLGGLRGAAQLLERQLESQELKEYTSIIINEADRLQNLMSRMLGSYHKSEPRWLNIHEVLQRVLQLVTADVDARLKLIADYDPSIPQLYADFDQLVQIFLNIVLNAVQALKGVGQIIIRTRIRRHIIIEKQSYRLGVCIEIEDNGPGIPESIRENLFYPLVTSRAEGTGLGLYLVQNLVHRNKGIISCTSHNNATIFTVIFPLEQPSE